MQACKPQAITLFPAFVDWSELKPASHEATAASALNAAKNCHPH